MNEKRHVDIKYGDGFLSIYISLEGYRGYSIRGLRVDVDSF